MVWQLRLVLALLTPPGAWGLWLPPRVYFEKEKQIKGKSKGSFKKQLTVRLCTREARPRAVCPQQLAQCRSVLL